MKRWLAVAFGSAVIFALGVFLGVHLEYQANTRLNRTMYLLLADNLGHHGREALLTMTLLASGRTDAAYDLAESAALVCGPPLSLENRKRSDADLLDCSGRLREFYNHFPERKAELVRRNPFDAQRLGFGPAAQSR
jgi:hypothetical protein